jgi:TruD family tRNA pseudouridine synthase
MQKALPFEKTQLELSSYDSEYINNALKAVGIALPKTHNRIQGRLYLTPEDFIVRELHSIPCTIDKKVTKLATPKYIHFIMVKRNISTFEACNIFAEKNGIDYYNDINYCGLKDTLGVTAQKICIKNIDIKQKEFDKFFIKEIGYSNKHLRIGSHIGNNFTISVRDVMNFEELDVSSFDEIIRKGIPNFYGLQRFGVRQNNHWLGKLLLTKKYDEFIVKFLTDTNHESKEISELRNQMSKHNEDWNKCLELIKDFDGFSDEKELLYNLLKMDKLEAIRKMKLSQFFVHSYASYLFNIIMSQFLSKNYKRVHLVKLGKNAKLDDTNKELYQEILESEGITFDDFENCDLDVYAHFRPTLFFPKNFSCTCVDKDIVLKFDLGKGQYASMILDFIVESNDVKWC